MNANQYADKFIEYVIENQTNDPNEAKKFMIEGIRTIMNLFVFEIDDIIKRKDTQNDAQFLRVLRDQNLKFSAFTKIIEEKFGMPVIKKDGMKIAMMIMLEESSFLIPEWIWDTRWHHCPKCNSRFCELDKFLFVCHNCNYVNEMETGLQVIYHTEGKTESGFITSLKDNEFAFVRYWQNDEYIDNGQPVLRTTSNSELTPISKLTVHKSISQNIVDEMVKQLNQK